MDGRRFIAISISLMTLTLFVFGALLIKNSHSAPTEDNSNKIVVNHIDKDTNKEIVVPDVYVCEESYQIEPREITGYKYDSSEGETKGKCPNKEVNMTFYYLKKASTPKTNNKASFDFIGLFLGSAILIVSILIVLEIIKNKKLS